MRRKIDRDLSEHPRLSKRREVGLGILGVLVFLIVSFALEAEVGIPFDTTYRVACAAVCLLFIYGLRAYYPGERWTTISFWVAALVNAGIFSTPLVNGPSSRGEVILFALPDAIAVLCVRIATYSVVDDHQRAMRQQMILGLVVAAMFFGVLLAFAIAYPRTAHG